MVEALTLVTLGSPTVGRSAVAAALQGRRVAAQATLLVADGGDDDRLRAELRQARRARPADRLVVVIETPGRTGGATAEAIADAVIRLHPRCGGRTADAALAARRIESALTGLGVLAPAAADRPPMASRWLAAVVGWTGDRRAGGLATG